MTVVPAPQVVARGPGVTPYRARKPPELQLARLCGYGAGVLCLRCHDLDLAVAMLLDDDLLVGTAGGDALDVLVETAARVWLRWVPDEYGNPESPGAWERELRGTTGATPAILFTHPQPATPQEGTP